MSTASFRKKLHLSQLQLAEMTGIHSFSIGVHEKNDRPLRLDDMARLTEFQLLMLGFDEHEPIRLNETIRVRTTSTLEKQRREVLSALMDLPVQIQKMKDRLQTMHEYYEWAEGYLRTIQFLTDHNGMHYLQSPAVKREIEVAHKYYSIFNVHVRRIAEIQIDLLSSKLDALHTALLILDEEIAKLK